MKRIAFYDGQRKVGETMANSVEEAAGQLGVDPGMDSCTFEEDRSTLQLGHHPDFSGQSADPEHPSDGRHYCSIGREHRYHSRY